MARRRVASRRRIVYGAAATPATWTRGLSFGLAAMLLATTATSVTSLGVVDPHLAVFVGGFLAVVGAAVHVRLQLPWEVTLDARGVGYASMFPSLFGRVQGVHSLGSASERAAFRAALRTSPWTLLSSKDRRFSWVAGLRRDLREELLRRVQTECVDLAGVVTPAAPRAF